MQNAMQWGVGGGGLYTVYIPMTSVPVLRLNENWKDRRRMCLLAGRSAALPPDFHRMFKEVR